MMLHMTLVMMQKTLKHFPLNPIPKNREIYNISVRMVFPNKDKGNEFQTNFEAYSDKSFH